MRRRVGTMLSAAAMAALAGCGGEPSSPARAGVGHPDPGDTLQGQGVEIVDGRFVPELVSVAPAQRVNFINRDDAGHRIVKVSGPGRDFRSELLEPGERYALSLVGRPGHRLRSGTVVYRSTAEGHPSARIAVYGTAVPRSDASERREASVEPPVHPDRAARRRARNLAHYVSQCADFRRCDTGAELVRNVGGGHALRFVRGSRRGVVESDVATHGPEIRLGSGPDETEIEATRDTFAVVSHSRTGRDFVLEGRGRDPRGWSGRWRSGD